MTTQEITEYLSNYNEWRRGNEDIEIPNPKKLWKVIDEAIGELKMDDSAIGELQFANMRISHIMNVLEEIVAITQDNLVNCIIKNAKSRDYIDVLVHTRKLFT